MKDLWKGIAIAGIWLSYGLCYWAVAIYSIHVKIPKETDFSWLTVIVFILSLIITFS